MQCVGDCAEDDDKDDDNDEPEVAVTNPHADGAAAADGNRGVVNPLDECVVRRVG